MQAARIIDRQLATRPFESGEPFYGDRIFIVAPLAITYSIREQDRLVQVLQVWHQ